MIETQQSLITGFYGCRCHPFTSWDEWKKAYNQKLEVGTKVYKRHTGKEGEIYSVGPERGFVIVKYGELPCDLHLEHVEELNKL